MGALSWLLNLGFAGGGAVTPAADTAATVGGSMPPGWKPPKYPDIDDWQGKSAAARRILLERAVAALSDTPAAEEARAIVAPFVAPASRETGAPIKLAKRQIPALADDLGRVRELIALYHAELEADDELLFMVTL